MSKSSGPSRIPTFGSKLPQYKPKSLITSKDIGKRVRIVEKEGVLRYVGNVHFSNGVWCGVELNAQQGKNDGAVNGVRYFACPQNCGLMAPLNKVALVDIDDLGSYIFIDRENDCPGNLSYDLEAAFNLIQPVFNKTTTIPTDKNKINECLQKREATFYVNKNPSTIQENLTNDTFNSNGIKRRRTINENLSQPLSLPQLKNQLSPTFECVSPPRVIASNFCHSTPRSETKTQRTSEDDTKRDSLDFDESLGILTPDRMLNEMHLMETGLELLDEKLQNVLKVNESDETLTQSKILTELEHKSELPSPNVVDASITDFSLGIIDEQLLANLTLKSDTTMNMELPLDTIDQSLNNRIEQTPSPEDLPLDPSPIITETEKTEPTKSKTSSFITSITSITSLDTGYQGDGEMSRPASRGADNSPLTRRPLPRPQPRRPDPLTDSDFYTESDADNHEENPLRGDRRAQVIDGTLYGVDPQAAADIYVNNRENMDSSGIFTDIESNTRTEDSFPVVADVSPSDTSTKTISGNSQQEIIDKKDNNDDVDKPLQLKENPKKRNASSPIISSPSSVRSPRHGNKTDSSNKKYKMPKRDVVSKVKIMIEPAQQNDKKILKKPAGRWDAVMNKITKTEQTKTNLKDVKSKVFNNVTFTSPRPNDDRNKTNRLNFNQKSPNLKSRRVRTRTTPQKNVGSSIHSSMSDLSANVASPKKILGSTKTRDIQVTQVLTASKLTPIRTPQQNATENKKASIITSNEIKSKKTLFSSKEKKPTVKDCSRGASVKGGRTSPVVRPPVLARAPTKPTPKVTEALAVLVQHLVFNVEAFKVPSLKSEIQKFRMEADDVRLVCQQLEESLAGERARQAELIEKAQLKYENQIYEIMEKHKNEILQLNNQQYELEQRMLAESEVSKQQQSQQNDEKLLTLKREFLKLQKMHDESLDILREENDAIREQIDEKNDEIEQIKHESVKLKDDYEAKEIKLNEQLNKMTKENQKLKQEIVKMDEKIKEQLEMVKEENNRLREENDRLLSYGDNNGISVQEVQSLRVVLELKQNEVADLRRALAEAKQKNDVLIGAEEKVAVLHARCEDLQLQLQRKSEYEQSLLMEHKKLQESFKEETNQKKRLHQYNEELQWKLKQNKEVVNKVIEQAEESVFNRSLLSASFSERHHISPINKAGLERAFSFRENNMHRNNSEIRVRKSKIELDDLSPPNSPKVKGVVEKSDSVSYVLDLDESPDVVASRIVRRSFRNSTPPKTTPTKSPCNKRARMKNPLSLSASASAILPIKNEFVCSKSVSLRNGDCEEFFCWTNSTPKSNGQTMFRPKMDNSLDLDEENEVDLKLPALPSEMDRKNGVHQALPSPKHLAGEAMISESNSEDESTSSSSAPL